MITDCKWLLSNLAIGLERFALMDDHDFVAYVKCEGGLFHAIGNGVLNSPHVVLVDDERIDWGADRIEQLNNELRAQGFLRDGNELRLELEKLLTDVMSFQSMAKPAIETADRPFTLAKALGQPLVERAQELQTESARLLAMVHAVWKKLPQDEPVTAGQLAKVLQKLVKGEYREPLPKEVARELEKSGAPEPISVEDCAQLKGKTSKKWLRDETLHYFSTLTGWRTI